MPRLLVTGAVGVIGSHVVDLFLSNVNPQATLYQIDIRNPQVRELFVKELGWTPTLTLEQGLEKTVSYFRDSERVL